ncbi:Lrp/AsnC family transcriptional regulator [Hydrogenophaga sp. 5NK40-0174]|uniref:Lrp/AsnC family transcriptional regulator n=1 Tax=Hydrogenophaga sp. 5NK40-0174 TaxID=3127649 RepID=UPI0031085FD6
MEDLSIDSTDMRLLDLLQEDAGRSNLELAELAHVSPATSQRRVRRLEQLGLIERQVAILNPERLAEAIGHGLTAVVEISLAVQNEEAMQAFEAVVQPEPAVQQLYRLSPGPDYLAIVCVKDMPDYLSLAKRVLTAQANVRNVKAYFSTQRLKFNTALPIPRPIG